MADFKMNDNRPKKKSRLHRKKKPTVLVFDEIARKEYLTGFKKRKQEKKKKKLEEFEKLYKEEKKRIKAEAKESLKALLPKRKSLSQLDDIVNEELDFGTHTVKIAELSSEQIAEENSFIGENKVRYESDEESDNKESVHSNENFVEGMESDVKGKRRKKHKPGNESNASDFRTARDFKRAVMHQFNQKMQNSKIISKKEQLDKIKNRKKARREHKRREIRERKRSGKKKGKK